VLGLVKIIAVGVFGKTAFSMDFESSQIAEASSLKTYPHVYEVPYDPPTVLLQSPIRASRRHYIPSKNAALADKVQERRQHGDDPKDDPTANTHDVLSELLSTLHAEACAVSDNDTQDTLMALLFAGYDTMSITLTCALYQISQHPEVEEFILAESNAADSLDNPNQLQYVQGMQYETLILSLPETVVTRFGQKPLQLEDQPQYHCSYLADSTRREELSSATRLSTRSMGPATKVIRN
jgi:cytochrome P450